MIADRLEAADEDAIVRPGLTLKRTDIRVRAEFARKSRSTLIRIQPVRVVSCIDGRTGTEQSMRQHGAAAIGCQWSQFGTRGDRARGKPDGR